MKDEEAHSQQNNVQLTATKKQLNEVNSAKKSDTKSEVETLDLKPEVNIVKEVIVARPEEQPKEKTEDMLFSNFEVNSYHSKQVSADNSALAVSKINEQSYKVVAKKVRAANVNR